MIFVTVGSRNFQFDRLIKEIDICVKDGKIKDPIFAQIGKSDYIPQALNYTDFLDHDIYNQYIKECDIVVTHGGTGIIVNAVKMGKRVIAVPRLSAFHEAVDDHQTQLIKEFEKAGMIVACYDCSEIASAIDRAKGMKAVGYHSNTDEIIKSIEEFFQ